VSRSRLVRFPRIEGSNVPDVSFGIATGKCFAAMAFLFEIGHHRGAGKLGAGIDSVYVCYYKIWSLRFGSADLVRLFLQVRQRRPILDRADHDHAVAKSQLSMHHCAVRTGINHLLLKPEGTAQPVDHGFGVSIAEPWDHGRFAVSGEGCHVRHSVTECVIKLGNFGTRACRRKIVSVPSLTVRVRCQ
jgi:hypothetical protein